MIHVLWAFKQAPDEKNPSQKIFFDQISSAYISENIDETHLQSIMTWVEILWGICWKALFLSKKENDRRWDIDTRTLKQRSHPQLLLWDRQL